LQFTKALSYNMGLALLVAACAHRQDAPVPQTPTTAYQGSVRLVTEFGAPVANNSNVVVSVADRPDLQTLTDAAGRFALQVPQGAPRLSFTKAGYGPFLSAALAVAAAPIVSAQPVTLGQLSSTYVTYVQGWIYDPVNHNYSLRGRINAPSNPPGQVRYHRLFLALSPDVSPSNYKATVLFSGSFPDPGMPSWNVVSDTVARATFSLVRAGARPVDQVYGVIYGDNPAADTYVDPAAGLVRYPAVGSRASDVFVCNP
jgi:hypothetical protein